MLKILQLLKNILNNPLFFNNSKNFIIQKRQYSTYNLPKNFISNDILSKFKLKSEFLNWFTGFTDVEGHFGIIFYRRTEVGFRFIIGLHLNDLEVLKFIKSELNYLSGKEVGIINIFENSVKFSIQNFYLIKELIIPIFKVFPLRSAKYLEFKDWEGE